MGKVIGIDLGTTNSCVAVMEGGTPVVIANAEGFRTTPSVVAFSKNGERVVGDTARRQAVTNPDGTISSIKRAMGSDYRVKLDGNSYSPQEISAMILQKLRRDAEDYLGEPVTEAVITVPAYFTDAQRQATKDAGMIAGLEVRRIINEPTAAALAYGLDNGRPQKILVYDLGGGTFDVSVIEIGDKVIEVLATCGDNHLGGDDFDARITRYLMDEFRRMEGVDLTGDTAAIRRVQDEAEKAKKDLSSTSVAVINLPFLTMDRNGAHHMDIRLTRAKFDELTADLVARTEIPVKTALSDAGLRPSDLNMVLLVGGSTRIPAVQDMVRRLTGLEPSRNMNPDECVAMGAAIQGSKFESGPLTAGNTTDIILMDVTPLTLSIETVGGVATRIIPRNSTIPTRHSQIFTTASPFQRAVEIKVLQGERQFAKDNKLIGNFRLDGLKRGLTGMPKIEVTFDIDANGIVTVSAKDQGNGKEQHITITGSSNLSAEELDRARRDAAAYESADRKKKELVDIRNEAESLVYQVEAILKDEKKSLDRNQRGTIKADLLDLKKKVNTTKPETITERQAGEIREAKERLESSAASLLQRKDPRV